MSDVALFATCLGDLLYPGAVEASVRLLRASGATVHFPASQTCCGQPAFNSGFRREARRVGRRLLSAFRGYGTVVAPSGSCTAMLRVHFPHLFEGTPDEAAARDLASRTSELCEYLDRTGLPDVFRHEGRIVLHASCHQLRELGGDDAVRRVLARVAGLEVVPLPHQRDCCGFGGTFSIRLPDVSVAMGAEKVDEIVASGVSTLVSSDPGCLLHLAGRLSATGAAVRVQHTAEFLAGAGGLA